jgi:hypothetical protein
MEGFQPAISQSLVRLAENTYWDWIKTTDFRTGSRGLYM